MSNEHRDVKLLRNFGHRKLKAWHRVIGLQRADDYNRVIEQSPNRDSEMREKAARDETFISLQRLLFLNKVKDRTGQSGTERRKGKGT